MPQALLRCCYCIGIGKGSDFLLVMYQHEPDKNRRQSILKSCRLSKTAPKNGCPDMYMFLTAYPYMRP